MNGNYGFNTETTKAINKPKFIPKMCSYFLVYINFIETHYRNYPENVFFFGIGLKNIGYEFKKVFERKTTLVDCSLIC